MSDAAPAAPAKKAPKKAAAPKKPAAHPPSSAMVKAAIKALADKKGSSLAAIKKYVAANYKVNNLKFEQLLISKNQCDSDLQFEDQIINAFLKFQVDIVKTLTNMKCAPEQVVWVGARENAEMESSEEKLALHLHFIHCAHLQNKCPELQGVNVAGTSMGEKRMQKTARRRYLDDCDLPAN